MNNRKKRFSLLLVLFFLCRCISFWPEQDQERTLTAQENYTCADASFNDQVGVPEVTGNRIISASAVNSLYINSSRGRTTLGKILAAFLFFIIFSGAVLYLSFMRFHSFCNLRNRSNILSFIHDQDGKKRRL